MDKLAENLENTFVFVQREKREKIAKKMVSQAKKDEYFDPLVDETSIN